jgi:hypothetical protein
VQRHRRQPLVAANDEGDAHQMVIDRVREVVGGKPRLRRRGLEDDGIVSVRIQLDAAADTVVEGDTSGAAGGSTEAKHVGISALKPGSNLGLIEVAAASPIAVIAGGHAAGALLVGEPCKLVPATETRVGVAAAKQLARVARVDRCALRLPVRPVSTVRVALVDVEAEVGEGAGELGIRVGDEAAAVGVLDPDEEASAGGAGKVARDRRRVDAADVDEPGRRRAVAGHLRANGKSARRVAALPIDNRRQVGREERVDERVRQRGHDRERSRTEAGMSASGAAAGQTVNFRCRGKFGLAAYIIALFKPDFWIWLDQE